MMTYSYLPLCCFFAVVAGLRWTRASSLPLSLLLFTLLWLFSLRNNSALQSNRNVFFVDRKNKEYMLVFSSWEAVSSRTIPRHSSADLGSIREMKATGISSDCVGWGGGNNLIIIINILECNRRLSYLSSVYTVLYKLRQLISTLLESCVFEKFCAKIWKRSKP